MRILIATSEAAPFAKTGGLADVCGALPIELAKLDHEPVVIMPAYRQVHQVGLSIEPTGIEFDVPIGSKTVVGTLLVSELPGSHVPIYFVAQDDYFNRGSLYQENGEDFQDNCERFTFFCRAVMESMRLLHLHVDVVHANDWQTSLLPAYLKTEYAALPGYEGIASLLTIHNLAYQGNFWHWDMALTGLDWKYFNWRQMEFYGNLNLLKTGLAFADAINTVSPRYAQEIQTATLGCGLEGMLVHRRDDLSGIINGVDYREWNPETDPHIAANYDVTTVHEKKPECKAALQREFGLPDEPSVPLIGVVGRLAEQKGCDLILEVMRDWVEHTDAQWVILGTGEGKLHEAFTGLAKRHPNHVAVRLEFSNPLAHRVEAGSDIFLMPSRYEPCGLNQLYSLRYGTIPVVRATGGLADTITDADSDPNQANGFRFEQYSSLALGEALFRACEMYRSDKECWQRLVETGMRQDWSWVQSARKYERLYQTTVSRVRQAVCT